MKNLNDKDFMKAFSQVETEDEAKGFFFELFKKVEALLGYPW